MTKTQALRDGSYIHLDLYQPVTEAMQATVKAYREITGCDVMPTSDTLLRGLGVRTTLDNVHFVTPADLGLTPDYSSNIAPMFLFDYYTAAVEDGAVNSAATKQQVLLRASTAYNKYSADLAELLNECGHTSNTDTTSEVQE